MAILNVPYETAEQFGVSIKLEVPDERVFCKCIPREPAPLKDVANEAERAVENPSGGQPFSRLVQKAKRVTFITENQFRAAPARDILPPLVDRCIREGLDVSIVIGCGKVPPLSEQEIEEKLGTEVVRRGLSIQCNDVSQEENYRYIGTTRAGVPLFVHKAVVEADLVVSISTTQATLWGYGGSGMIIPAVAGNATIELNHVLSMAPDCIPGNNHCLMQQDKYEALKLATVQMGINVIVDNKAQPIFINAGPPVESHMEAVRYYDGIYRFELEALGDGRADIGITGSTAPTDHLFFHTGWAVVNLDPAVRDGGIIIQATPCPGYGDWPGFALMDLMQPYMPPSGQNLVRAIRDIFERQKELWAGCIWYKIYEVMTRKEVWIVTEERNLSMCREIGLTAFSSLDEAFEEASRRSGRTSKVAFVPFGRYSVLRPKA